MNLSGSHIRLIIRGSLLELWRRQDVWILTLLMGIFAAVAGTARITGDTSPATGTFMLNLGMSLAVLFAQGLTALIAVRQFPDEIENRTLYPLLAKPLDRDSLLAGKWLACVIGGQIIFLAFHLLTLAVSPASEPIHGVLHVQHLMVQLASLYWTAALGILLSLLLPRALALCITLLLVFGGNGLFHSVVNEMSVLPHFLPRFGALNLTTRLTDGIVPLAPAEMGILLLYLVGWTVLCLSLGRSAWTRRAL